MLSTLGEFFSTPKQSPLYDPKNIETWPTEIKMNGLPWSLMGWNCYFYYNGEKSEGEPVYPYTLFCMFPIIGVRIMKHKGRWILRSQEDDGFMMYNSIYKLGHHDKGPEGIWSYSAYVTIPSDDIYHYES